MASESHGARTFTAGGTIPQYARVKFDGTTADSVVVATASDKAAYLGVAQTGGSSGDLIKVALKGGYRTFKCIAAEAIATNTVIYAADDGEVKDTSNGNPIGHSLEASIADQDIIECVLLDQVAVV
jgi:hypothetical protein